MAGTLVKHDMGPELASTPLTPGSGSMWSYKADDNGVDSTTAFYPPAPSAAPAMGAVGGSNGGSSGGAVASTADRIPPGGPLWPPQHSAPRSPLPPKPASSQQVRPQLRVNTSLPPVEKTQGTGLRIRAWDPTQDPVVSPRHAEWSDVDPRLSPLSFNVSSPVSTYSNSPESDLESSFSSLFVSDGPNSLETPTGGASGAHDDMPPPGYGRGNGMRFSAHNGSMGPAPPVGRARIPHGLPPQDPYAHHVPHHPMGARGGGLISPRLSPSPRAQHGAHHSYGHLSGQSSPRWGGPNQSHLPPPHHQQYAQPRSTRHLVGPPGRRTPKGKRFREGQTSVKLH